MRSDSSADATRSLAASNDWLLVNNVWYAFHTSSAIWLANRSRSATLPSTFNSAARFW
jgi:hypothetical protein